MRAILTLPRYRLKKSVPEILAAGVSEPRPVELLGGVFAGQIRIFLEEVPLVVGEEPDSLLEKRS